MSASGKMTMTKVTQNGVVRENDPIDWYTPGTAWATVMLRGAPSHVHVTFILELANSGLSHDFTLGPGDAERLAIENFEPVLRRLPANQRILFASFINHAGDQPADVTVCFLFPSRDPQYFDYTIAAGAAGTVVFRVNLVEDDRLRLDSTTQNGAPSATASPINRDAPAIVSQLFRGV